METTTRPGRRTTRTASPVLLGLAGLLGVLGLAGCGEPVQPVAEPTAETLAPSSSSASPSAAGPSSAASASGSTSPAPAGEATAQAREPGPRTSDGSPRAATLSVPQIGMDAMAVESYRGTTDDAAGTAIQDGGVLASPFGPDGGVGPGGVGNYLVTGHRLSSTQAFLDLPVLGRGDRFTVTAGGRDYVYEVRRTRITSFRSPDSLAAQRAAVPGRPGAEPTRAMITLSTCRTPEDRAEGNTWSDQFGNPENRIDKIGVLVASRPA